MSRRDERGQGLAEFAFVLIPFFLLLLGVVDLGRGIHMNNGVAEAAREIARATSVHQCSAWPCTTSTYSAQTSAVIATQKQLVPGLTDAGISITCVDVGDVAVPIASGGICPPDDYIRVNVSGSFQLVTPLLPVPNPMTLSSVSHVQVP